MLLICILSLIMSFIAASCVLMVTTRPVTAIWPWPARPSMVSTRNTASALPFEGFLHELLLRSRTSHSCLQVALFYFLLLEGKRAGLYFMKDPPEHLGASACRSVGGRRMFLASLMLASKGLQDREPFDTGLEQDLWSSDLRDQRE
jgi:hypothetical protein